jgi:D-alanyl-D-alanine carboxypeptidase
MKKTVLSILLLCSLISLRAQTFNPLLANMLQDTLDTYVGMISNIKGYSAAVYVPGQGTWTGTAGVSFTGQPITADMRFGIASNTKLFVATSMMILVEDNIVTLNDPVSMWLPSYPNVNPNITIRQLLNHTSGLSDPIFVSPWMDTIMAHPTRVFTPTEVVGWLGAPLCAPGAGWNYSNVNYILLGMIAESATGFHISQIIRDSILTPLGMDSTFYDVQETAVGTISHRWWNTVDYNDTSRIGLNTAGGCAGAMFSTASEMANWYRALFEGQIVNQQSIDEITTFVSTPNPASDYGMGITRETTQGRTYWGHGGATWGYRSKMIYDTCTTVTVAGLTNSYPSGMEAVTFLLYRCVMNHIPGGCGLTISGSNTVCQNTSGVVYTVPVIPGATSYQWTLPSGATGISVTNSIAVNYGVAAISGDIIVRGVNLYGAGGFSTMHVTVNPTPATPVITQNGNQLSSSALIGNQWYDSNGMLAGETNQVYNFTVTEDYYTIVTLNGCSSDTSNVIHAVPLAVETYSAMQCELFPNPANNGLTVKSPGEFDVVVYDITGRIVATKNGNRNACLLDVRDWAPGIYTIKISRGNESSMAKLVRE